MENQETVEMRNSEAGGFIKRYGLVLFTILTVISLVGLILFPIVKAPKYQSYTDDTQLISPKEADERAIGEILLFYSDKSFHYIDQRIANVPEIGSLYEKLDYMARFNSIVSNLTSKSQYSGIKRVDGTEMIRISTILYFVTMILSFVSVGFTVATPFTVLLRAKKKRFDFAWKGLLKTEIVLLIAQTIAILFAVTAKIGTTTFAKSLYSITGAGESNAFHFIKSIMPFPFIMVVFDIVLVICTAYIYKQCQYAAKNAATTTNYSSAAGNYHY